MSEPNFNKLVFFDTETTGFKPPYIISIAMIAYENGKRTCAKYLVCNPDYPITYGASKVNGFTNESVQDLEEFPAIWGEISYYFENAIWIGHNVNFDQRALSISLSRYNGVIPKHWTCDTVENAKALIPSTEVNNYKLNTLCDYFGISLENHHQASDDTIACLRIYNKLVELSNGNLIIRDEVLPN